MTSFGKRKKGRKKNREHAESRSRWKKDDAKGVVTTTSLDDVSRSRPREEKSSRLLEASFTSSIHVVNLVRPRSRMEKIRRYRRPLVVLSSVWTDSILAWNVCDGHKRLVPICHRNNARQITRVLFFFFSIRIGGRHLRQRSVALCRGIDVPWRNTGYKRAGILHGWLSFDSCPPDIR